MARTNHVRAHAGVIKSLQPGLTNADILDLASGTGQSTILLSSSAQSCRFTLMDFSPGMLEIAHLKLKAKNDNQYALLQRDAHDLNTEESYDYAVCSYGFYWFARPLEVAKAVFRALRPHGTFLVLEERFFDPHDASPAFAKTSSDLAKLAMLEAYIGITSLKGDILGPAGFSFVKETSVQIDDKHELVGILLRK